ncbi:tetratricopeptide repeat protein (plasmid) [Klebsiella sp. WOUb02]|uniref:tetratricopeptide repeat protein n=1 Tax=Klebsiella sp. WOUb02 TaxID=3161071 RepID=UPI003CFBBAEA
MLMIISIFPRVLSVLLCGVLLAGCAGSHTLKGSKDEGLKLARLLRDQGRLEAAVEVYARLDSRGHLSGSELLEYASVAAPVRTPQETLNLYVRARQQLGGDLQRMQKTEALALCLGIGRAQLALGRTQMAEQDFQCALTAAPDNVGALNGSGVVLDANGRHDEARIQFGKALRSDPSDIAALNNLALSWLISGRADKAIELLRTTDNSAPSARLNLALAYLYDSKDEQARKTLADIASSDRIESLMNSLAQRVGELKQPQTSSSSLLIASRNLLQLSDVKE